MKKAEIIVDGDVQGVGYRYEVRRTARRHKLLGNVKNLEDGRIRIIAEGKEEDIKKFLEDINIKAPPIHVENINYEFAKPTGKFKSFTIITDKLGQEMVEGFSTGMVYLQAIRDDVRGVGEKVDGAREEIRGVGEKVDVVAGEVVRTREELKEEIAGMRSDLRSYLDERFMKLEREVEKIKEKIGI